ncbi:MAG: transposase [Singulisphaera sp.]|nr:transposase [Singulisphaera sp.]
MRGAVVVPWQHPDRPVRRGAAWRGGTREGARRRACQGRVASRPRPAARGPWGAARPGPPPGWPGRCGHVAKSNRKSQAEFECGACGHRDHADKNAARNIRNAALVQAGAQAAPKPASGLDTPPTAG